VAILLLRQAGSFLIVSAPEPADVIAVAHMGESDSLYWNGVRLMQAGYAPHLLLEVLAYHRTAGLSDMDLAHDFVERTTPGQSTVCPIAPTSIYDEPRFLAKCLEGSGAKSVLLVSSDYHSRLELSIMRRKLPRYHYSIYAAPDPFSFGQRWWTNREWAKTTVAEWQAYLWWTLVERWRGVEETN
jgi:uncharacterized SAM-binding protein YcdF (DUF218 family)